MTTGLEDRLRAALRTGADHAPLSAPEWAGPRYIGTAPPRRPALLPAAAAVLLAALVVGFGVAMSTRNGAADGTHTTSPDREMVATTSVPEPATGVRPPFLRGDEYPLVPVDPPAINVGEAVRPGSVRTARLPDVDLVVGFFEMDGGADGARPRRCVYLTVLSSCGDDASSAGVGIAHVQVPSTGEFVYVATWIDVPAGTAYVQFVDPDGTARWQRPLGTTAVFRASANKPKLTAFDADGREL